MNTDEFEIPKRYVQWYHERNIWKSLMYRGVRTLKYPMDMWNYQEIFHEHRIEWVVETGTRHGGSALFFADILAGLGSPGRVITLDVTPEPHFDIDSHPLIDLIVDDSGSPEIANRIYASMPPDRGPLFLILDSDHAKGHVLRELQAHVPHLRPGDYLVVEDTIVNGHPVRPEHGPGPREALEEFLQSGIGSLVRDEPRNQRFGYSCADDGYFRITSG